jgi:hypothetical protein
MSEVDFEESWTTEELEDYIADRLALQENAQIEVDECIANSDLYGAAMGSFKHALVSFELGDRQTGHSYLFMATVLAEADVILEAAAASVDPLYQEVDLKKILERPTTFQVPSFIRAYALLKSDLDKEHDTQSVFERDIVDSLDALNTIWEFKDIGAYDNVELNMGILKAINSIGVLMYERICKYEMNGATDLNPEINIALLKLSKEVATYAAVNEDLASTEIALEINEQLLLIASASPRAVLSSLTHARRIFQEISEGPYAKSLGGKAQVEVNLHAARQAIQSYGKRTGAMPLFLFMSLAASSQDFTMRNKEWPRLRTSNAIRSDALEAYGKKLPAETRTLLGNRNLRY